jgi:hypothetical protein
MRHGRLHRQLPDVHTTVELPDAHIAVWHRSARHRMVSHHITRSHLPA